jgi:hypothetical protein
MVIREWRGRASRSRAEAYPRHFRDKVVPELRRVPGFVGTYLSQRRFDDRLSFWCSRCGGQWVPYEHLRDPRLRRRSLSPMPLPLSSNSMPTSVTTTSSRKCRRHRPSASGHGRHFGPAHACFSTASINKHSAATGGFYSLSAARCRYMAAVQENAEPSSGSPVSGWKYSAKPVRSTNARLS